MYLDCFRFSLFNNTSIVSWLLGKMSVPKYPRFFSDMSVRLTFFSLQLFARVIKTTVVLYIHGKFTFRVWEIVKHTQNFYKYCGKFLFVYLFVVFFLDLKILDTIQVKKKNNIFSVDFSLQIVFSFFLFFSIWGFALFYVYISFKRLVVYTVIYRDMWCWVLYLVNSALLI